MTNRGRPKKVISELDEVTDIANNKESEMEISKTRLQELQELHAILVRENIHSISKLEAMIAQLS